jgi:pantetheine-phosphate adenylyltransferase
MRIFACIIVLLYVQIPSGAGTTYTGDLNALTNDSFILTGEIDSTKMAKTIKAVYPGSFDPITNGHVDIIKRGLKLFDNIIVAVLENPKKQPLFTTKERMAMIDTIFSQEKNVEVKSFHGLLVDFVKHNEATIVIRGLRAISDFEYEFQMTLMNRKLNPNIETLFMMPNVDYSFLSSKLVKEVCLLGGCLKDLVPKIVESKLKAKLRNRSNLSLI